MDFRRWDPGSEGKVRNRADLSHDNKIGMIWFRYGISAKRARRDLRRDIRYRGNMGFEGIPLWRSLDWTWNQEDQSQDYRESACGKGQGCVASWISQEFQEKIGY
ncbi:hypothetical protein HID58_042007 [Brassica napus]|uniref:Uncharacterized protein n=1 Tax=Brassica napus TaxID=3708 RepID=A0ABQ8BCG4_BRANA|nr:hypothetical protein HID58_042007 [Brassica napus]